MIDYLKIKELLAHVIRSVWRRLPLTVSDRLKVRKIIFEITLILKKIFLLKKGGQGVVLADQVYLSGIRHRVSMEQPGSIAVIAHVYYMDLWPQLLTYLSNLPFEYSLYISTDSEDKKREMEKLAHRMTGVLEVHIKIFPNIGRDVAPLFVGFKEVLDQHDYYLHIHTKKTVYDPQSGQEWMKYLLDGLIGSPKLVEELLDVLSLSSVGCVFPPLFKRLGYHPSWGTNLPAAKKFFYRIFGKELKARPTSIKEFPAGFMFWCKRAVLSQTLKIKLTWNDFEADNSQPDGTAAHALERLLPYITEEIGLRVITARPSTGANNGPFVSVVIPAYNCAATIAECLESVLRQSYRNYEIVVVDDGSTDATSEILEQYENNYRCIKCIRQANRGTGAARNAGVKKAKSEYITFLDSDDIMHYNALHGMLTCMQNDNCDLVVSPLQRYRNGLYAEICPRDFLFSKISNYPPEKLPALFSDFGPCAKLYKRAFLEQNQIRFPEGVAYEDNLFIYRTYLESSAISVYPEVTYFYRDRSNSNATNITAENLQGQAWQFKEIRKLLKNRSDRLTAYANIAMVQKITSLMDMVLELPKVGPAYYDNMHEAFADIPDRVIKTHARQHAAHILGLKYNTLERR